MRILCQGQVLLFAFALPIQARAADPTIPKASEFLEGAARHWAQLDHDPAKNIDFRSAPKHSVFLPIGSLVRGQDQISVDNIAAKFAEKKGFKDLVWDDAQKRWSFAFNNGTSSTSLADPIQVVKGPQGYVIIDGHHDVFLSLYTGATTVAAEVKEDLSHLSPEKFWQTLHDRHLIYLKDSPKTLAKHPPVMGRVIDNPNRYLASLLALKAAGDFAPGATSALKVKGAKVPVWVKVNDSIPFIEFIIADALSAAGIQYDPKWGTQVPAEIIEKSRIALLNAQKAGRLPAIPLLANAAEAVAAATDQAQLRRLLAPNPAACGAEVGAIVNALAK